MDVYVLLRDGIKGCFLEKYTSYQIDTTDEVIVALLSAFEFESFYEEDDKTIGYISDANAQLQGEEIDQMLLEQGITFVKEQILPQNWNAIWESSFQPVEVNQFCRVRADFHPFDDQYRFDIIINPKMAFGTGHHATTWMMMALMETLDFQDKKVLDYGAGTGILAILASKCNASNIVAVDIEEEAYHNMQENFMVNMVTNVVAIHGTIESVVKSAKYDIILANINRNILLDSVTYLHQYTSPNGIVLLSGFLEEDKDIIQSTYESNGFRRTYVSSKDSWASMMLTKIE